MKKKFNINWMEDGVKKKILEHLNEKTNMNVLIILLIKYKFNKKIYIL
jgi:hypothetical protein